ncbi:phosphatase PAP2 family protein [Streptomyces sp. GC420]|uniref:phosphatase PAP2 family protein n=1 Tax=Streptomyces sp. GC420 TaxID=2697568 RepID=UPI0028BE86B4|nr:phosphatase PAP2 family protein [Streptomyces sp. GC420]
MAAVGAILCLLFTLVTWQVVTRGPLAAADERLGMAVLGGTPRLPAELLADLGNVPVAVPVLAAAVVYAARHARHGGEPLWWLSPLAAVLAMAAVPSVVAPVKMLVDRQGPLTAATGYYPSGHTATAAVAYLGAALLLSPYLPGRRLVPAAVLLSTAAGLGLMLCGYHWPLDVVGSWCLSGLFLLPLCAARYVVPLCAVPPYGGGRGCRSSKSPENLRPPYRSRQEPPA